MKIQGNNILLSVKELTEKYQIPAITIRYGKTQLNNSWACFEMDGEIYVDYFSIPPQTRKKLPSYDALLSEYNLNKNEINGNRIAKAINDTQRQYARCLQQLKDNYGLRDGRAITYAKRWAAWQWIVANYVRTNNSLEQYYNAYAQIFPDHFKGKNAKNAFSNFLRKCRDKGVEGAVMDGRTLNANNKGRQSPHKSTWVTMASLVYAQNKKWSVPEIHEKIILACADKNLPMPSLSTVKKICRQLSKSPDLYAARYGTDAAKQKSPYADLIPALNILDQVQLDGWTLPFWAGGNFQRYTLVKIHDSHSRKIIGYSIATSESTEVITECLENAFTNTAHLPAEIVCDKHVFHKTQFAEQLRANTEKKGVIWTITTNPQHNGIAERYNKNLDVLCKKYHGYTGKNVTAKSKDARLSPEAYQELAKTKNQLTKDEVLAIGVQIVEVFNNTPLNELKGLTPAQSYEQGQAINAFPLSKEECISLFRPINQYKVIRGQITIKRGIKKYEYQLPAHLIVKYNDEYVNVVYDDLNEGIYIVDANTGEYEAIQPKPKIHSAKVNQTEDDIKHLNQLAGRKNAIAVKQRKALTQIQNEAMANDPDAVLAIAPYLLPKDTRQQLLQNRELKLQAADKGVSVNKLPIRSHKIEMPTPATETDSNGIKDKKSPFSDSARSIPEKLTFDDLVKQVNQF